MNLIQRRLIWLNLMRSGWYIILSLSSLHWNIIKMPIELSRRTGGILYADAHLTRLNSVTSYSCEIFSVNREDGIRLL